MDAFAAFGVDARYGARGPHLSCWLPSLGAPSLAAPIRIARSRSVAVLPACLLSCFFCSDC